MDEWFEQTPWLMTAEALWDFVARDLDIVPSAVDIAQDTIQNDETPLFI